MTKEQLEQMFKDMIAEQVVALGVKMTEGVKEQIAVAVKEHLKEAGEIFKPKIVPGEDPKSGFRNFAEFAQAVFKAESTKGREVDQRLTDMQKKAAGTPGLLEGTPDAGGYLVPEEFRASLLEVAAEKSNILEKCMIIPMNTLSIGIPYIDDQTHAGGLIHGGIQFKWLDEASEKIATVPKFGKITLQLNKCAGLCYMSDEILQDSPITVEPLLNRLFTDALAWQLDEVFLNGNGVAKPLGVTQSPCLVEVGKEAGQGGGTVVYENIVKMYSRMYSKTNAVWMANDDVFPQLATMSLLVGTGGGSAVYLPAGGASGKPYDTLLGKPLIFTEHCKAVGHKGDILFCDWSQYLVGQKAGAGGGLQFASSIHLKFDYDQTAFRFVFRVDGQPWWPAARIPRYGTQTKSPFIALEERGLES